MEDEEESEDELESHFKTLESLKQTDPAFYEYLQKNDQELLNFEDKSDEDDEEKGEDEQDEEQEEAEDGESKPAQTSQSTDKVRVTSELLKTWAASASKVKSLIVDEPNYLIFVGRISSNKATCASFQGCVSLQRRGCGQ